MFKAYYYLTKPGIVYSNTLTAIAGYLMASRWHIDWLLLIGLSVGVYLVIASACVFNNYIDREIDAVMERTSWRALAAGKVGPTAALVYGTILGVAGFIILITLTSWLVTLIGLIAYIDYIIFYGWTKRHTIHGTLVGTISGGASLVAGYATGSERLNTTAFLLFLLMLGWQMPHFYAIAVRRLKDYKKAGLKVLPAVKGIHRTTVEMTIYGVVFIASAALLTWRGDTGWIFLLVMGGLGLWWLWLIVQGFSAKDITGWAKRVFLFSLVIILALPVAVAFGPILP